MKKTINIEDLIEILEKNLTKQKNKAEKQSKIIETAVKILEGTNGVCCGLVQATSLLIASMISIGIAVGIFGSLPLSYYTFANEIVNGEVSTLIAVGILPSLAAGYFWYPHCGEIFKSCIEDVYELFSKIVQKEKNIFDSLFKEKYDQLFNQKKLTNEQLNDLKWFKDNFRYILTSETQNKPISTFDLKYIKQILQQEDLINVLYHLYQGHLETFKGLSPIEKDTLRKKTITKAEIVKNEADLIKKDITTKIENGERVRRIERYHIAENALSAVNVKLAGKSRKLTIKR